MGEGGINQPSNPMHTIWPRRLNQHSTVISRLRSSPLARAQHSLCRVCVRVCVRVRARATVCVHAHVYVFGWTMGGWAVRVCAERDELVRRVPRVDAEDIARHQLVDEPTAPSRRAIPHLNVPPPPHTHTPTHAHPSAHSLALPPHKLAAV